MNNQKIVMVEGKEDQIFLQSYFSHLDIAKEDINFKQLGSNIFSKREDIKDELEESDINSCYIICDTDDQKELYRETIKEILTELEYQNIDDFMINHVFLFPDNENNGELEDLIDKILVDNKGFNQCFKDYQDCLDDKNLRKIPIEAKIYSYDYTNGGKGKTKKYNNPELYNLNAEELKPLKEFCENILISSEII